MERSPGSAVSRCRRVRAWRATPSGHGARCTAATPARSLTAGCRARRVVVASTGSAASAYTPVQQMFKNIDEMFETRRQLQARRLQAPAPPLQQRTIRGERVSVRPVPELDRYMFDLQGYFVIRGAVGPDELGKMNGFYDETARGKEDFGLSAPEARTMMADPDSFDGKELQQGFGGPGGCEGIGGDPAFDCLIDHPSWVDHIRDFTNGDETVMTPGGGGVGTRWPGQASGAHGGGVRNGGFRWTDGDEEKGEPGRFRCQTVSVLLALNDSPVGGGNTFVVVRSSRRPCLVLQLRLSEALTPRCVAAWEPPNEYPPSVPGP